MHAHTYIHTPSKDRLIHIEYSARISSNFLFHSTIPFCLHFSSASIDADSNKSAASTFLCFDYVHFILILSADSISSETAHQHFSFFCPHETWIETKKKWSIKAKYAYIIMKYTFQVTLLKLCWIRKRPWSGSWNGIRCTSIKTTKWIRVEGVRSIHSPNNVIVYASIDLDSVWIGLKGKTHTFSHTYRHHSFPIDEHFVFQWSKRNGVQFDSLCA